MSVPTGAGNYPAGVSDNDPHFTDGDSDYIEDEAAWRARHDARFLVQLPPHDDGCAGCDECVCPF